jgi:DME family drug/metabolite transporter
MSILGDLFAVAAAASNGTIGVLSRLGFVSHASSHQVAFFRALGGWLVLTILALGSARLRRDVFVRRSRAPQFAICALFGIGVLYTCETMAFSLAPIPIVSFLTYASGVITIFLGVVYLKERMNFYKLASLVFVAVGVYVMFGGLGDVEHHIRGAILAMAGGLGYSLFLFLWRKWDLPGGLASLWWLFFFGMVCEGVPYVWAGAGLPPAEAWGSILALTLIPTLGGYYFTSKALSLTEAGRVQLIETSDPIFSSLFALTFYGDQLSVSGLSGAALILLGILVLVGGKLISRAEGTKCPPLGV